MWSPLLLHVVHVTPSRSYWCCSSADLALQVGLLKRLHCCVDCRLYLLVEPRCALALRWRLLLLPLLLMLHRWLMLLLLVLPLLLMLGRVLLCLRSHRRATKADQSLVSVRNLKLICDASMCLPH